MKQTIRILLGKSEADVHKHREVKKVINYNETLIINNKTKTINRK